MRRYAFSLIAVAAIWAFQIPCVAADPNCYEFTSDSDNCQDYMANFDPWGDHVPPWASKACPTTQTECYDEYNVNVDTTTTWLDRRSHADSGYLQDAGLWDEYWCILVRPCFWNVLPGGGECIPDTGEPDIDGWHYEPILNINDPC